MTHFKLKLSQMMVVRNLIDDTLNKLKMKSMIPSLRRARNKIYLIIFPIRSTKALAWILEIKIKSSQVTFKIMNKILAVIAIYKEKFHIIIAYHKLVKTR